MLNGKERQRAEREMGEMGSLHHDCDIEWKRERKGKNVCSSWKLTQCMKYIRLFCTHRYCEPR